MKHLSLALSLFISLGLATSSHAAQTPQEVVLKIIDHAKKLETKKLESYVDFEHITNSALGRYKRKTTLKQKKEITELLKTIIAKKAYPKAPKFFKDVAIKFTDENVRRKKVHLVSNVTKGKEKAVVEYWLTPENGSYRIVDLSIGGHKWVKNIREQFRNILKKRDIPTLITKMKKQVRKLSRLQARN